MPWEAAGARILYFTTKSWQKFILGRCTKANVELISFQQVLVHSIQDQKAKRFTEVG